VLEALKKNVRFDDLTASLKYLLESEKATQSTQFTRDGVTVQLLTNKFHAVDQ
jgi:hypothetical protein